MKSNINITKIDRTKTLYGITVGYGKGSVTSLISKAGLRKLKLVLNTMRI